MPPEEAQVERHHVATYLGPPMAGLLSFVNTDIVLQNKLTHG